MPHSRPSAVRPRTLLRGALVALVLATGSALAQAPSRAAWNGSIERSCAPYDGAAFFLRLAPEGETAAEPKELHISVNSALPVGPTPQLPRQWGVGRFDQPHGMRLAWCLPAGAPRAAGVPLCVNQASGTLTLRRLDGDVYSGVWQGSLESGREVTSSFTARLLERPGQRGHCG